MSLVTSTPTKALLQRRHRLPAKLREQPDGGPLDKLVFGVGVGHGVKDSFEPLLDIVVGMARGQRG